MLDVLGLPEVPHHVHHCAGCESWAEEPAPSEDSGTGKGEGGEAKAKIRKGEVTRRRSSLSRRCLSGNRGIWRRLPCQSLSSREGERKSLKNFVGKILHVVGYENASLNRWSITLNIFVLRSYYYQYGLSYQGSRYLDLIVYKLPKMGSRMWEILSKTVKQPDFTCWPMRSLVVLIFI